MSDTKNTQLENVLTTYQSELFEGWMSDLLGRVSRRDKHAEAQLRQQATQFLPLLADTLKKSTSLSIDGATWEEIRHLLSDISQNRARQGYSSIETAISCSH